MKRILAFVMSVVLLLVPNLAFAAIAFDNSANGGNTTSTVITWNQTVAAGGTLLVVYLDGDLSTNSDDIVSVTAGVTAMTKLKAYNVPSDRWQYAYYLLAPPTGTVTITATFSGSHAMMGYSASWTGTQTSGLDGTDFQTSASPVASTLVSTCDNDWHIGVAFSGGNAVAGANTTRRITDNSGFNGGGIFDNNAAITPAGTQTLNASQGGTMGFQTWDIAPSGVGPTCGGGATATQVGFHSFWW